MSARVTAGQAAWAAGAQLLSGVSEQVFEGAFTDSRAPVRNALFVALVGERHDGSQFAAAAARAGAAGVLVPTAAAPRVKEELAASGLKPALLAAPDTGRALGGLAHAWRESLPSLRVVCVTGSTGKTSTKELVAAVLQTAGATLKTEGNLNNEVGVPLTLLRLGPEHRHAVVEAGMNHLGEVARLAAWIDPDVGLVTNIGPVHLEGTGSIEGVAHAKGELFHALRDSGHLRRLDRRAGPAHLGPPRRPRAARGARVPGRRHAPGRAAPDRHAQRVQRSRGRGGRVRARPPA
jgi:UDP-N-acetylmuramoyl-tripeptide--D-alanyl-D-alanine ligase